MGAFLIASDEVAFETMSGQAFSNSSRHCPVQQRHLHPSASRRVGILPLWHLSLSVRDIKGKPSIDDGPQHRLHVCRGAIRPSMRSQHAQLRKVRSWTAT